MSWNPQSIKKVLAERAKALGIRMPQAQNLLAQERFLARLVKTEFGTKFVWKGGSLMLRAYSVLDLPRYTVDLDLLAKGVPVSDVREIFEKAGKIKLHDGFVFGKITSSSMERDLPYGGERFEVAWSLFSKQNSEKLKIDVAAGDVVSPTKMGASELFLCPQSDEPISLLVYPPEFIIAEKLETVLRFGTGNTRVKDLIDLWSLKRRSLDRKRVLSAIQKCFDNRKTKLDWGEINFIFSDQDYQEFVDGSLSRNYSDLKLPRARVLLDELRLWAADLAEES